VKRSHVSAAVEGGVDWAKDKRDAARRVPVNSKERVKIFPPFEISILRDEMRLKGLPATSGTPNLSCLRQNRSSRPHDSVDLRSSLLPSPGQRSGQIWPHSYFFPGDSLSDCLSFLLLSGACALRPADGVQPRYRVDIVHF
jgi:hypothetical protein